MSYLRKLIVWSAAIWSQVFLISQGIGYNFELSGMRGSVTSPQYPRNYPLNVTCKWTITAIRQRRIQIHFTDFSLEKNKKCLYDYLQIRESQTSSGRKIISRPTPKYCGYSLPQDYLSQGDQVEIIFVSDPMSEVDKGFRLIWTTVPTGSTEAPIELPSIPSLTSETVSNSRLKESTIISHTICPTKIITILKTLNCSKENANMPQQNCKCNETHETGLTAATTPNRLENSIKQSSYKKKIGAECAMIDSDDLQESSNNDYLGLAIAFGILFVIALIINFILLVIFCRAKCRQHLLPAEKPAVDEQNNVQHEEENEHEEHTLCEASDLPDLTNDLSQTEQSNLAGSSQGLDEIRSERSDSSSEVEDSDFYCSV